MKRAYVQFALLFLLFSGNTFCSVVTQKYFKDKYDDILTDRGIDVSKVFYVTDGRTNMLCIYKNGGKYTAVKLIYPVNGQQEISFDNSLANINYYIATQFVTYGNWISRQDLYNFYVENPDIITDRNNTNLMNMATTTGAYGNINSFYALCVSLLHPELNSRNIFNYVPKLKNLNYKTNQQFDVFLNSQNTWTIKNFNLDVYESIPQNGIELIFPEGVPKQNFNKFSAILINVLKLYWKQFALAIGGYVIFQVIYFGLYRHARKNHEVIYTTRHTKSYLNKYGKPTSNIIADALGAERFEIDWRTKKRFDRVNDFIDRYNARRAKNASMRKLHERFKPLAQRKVSRGYVYFSGNFDDVPVVDIEKDSSFVGSPEQEKVIAELENVMDSIKKRPDLF